MPQPKDYDSYATDPDFKQQIIIREKLVKEQDNSGFGKLRDGILLALFTAVGWIIWNMNERLTNIEGMMRTQEMLVRIIAKKNGIDIP